MQALLSFSTLSFSSHCRAYSYGPLHALYVQPAALRPRVSRGAQLRMDAGNADRLARLEASIRDLEALGGVGQEVLGPLKAELQKLKIENLEAQIKALAKETASAKETTPPKSPPPLPPQKEAEVVGTRGSNLWWCP
jgi:hypothetical protein